MAVSEFSAALNQVATERGISVDAVLESIKLALASAYKKDSKEKGEEVEIEDIVVDLDSSTGEAKILKDDKDVTPAGFGRIAAQTAKQVILQKIRETEKDVIMEEFKGKIGTIIVANVFKADPHVVIMDLGKPYAYGVMPQPEQVSSEQYRLNQRLKVLVKEIRETPKGPEIIVSRSDAEFIEKLFEQEVPEISSGVVKIEAIAREPGSRTKMAVSSSDEKIDPVGSCVGQKGVRVQSIISELYGEKIDIIPYSTSTERFIAAALSPAMVTEVELDEEEKRAIVSVPEDQQSLAIGKEGQNARLANKLTRWKIDIKGAAGVFGQEEEEEEKGDSKVVGVWDAAIAATRKAEEDEEAEIEAEKAAKDAEESVDTSEVQEVEETTESEDAIEANSEDVVDSSDEEDVSGDEEDKATEENNG